MSQPYICLTHTAVSCQRYGCDSNFPSSHSRACQCMLCLDARALHREQVRDSGRCMRYDTSTSKWCVRECCTGPRLAASKVQWFGGTEADAPIKCTKLSDPSTWCACDRCVVARHKVVRLVHPDGSETPMPLTPHGEKLRILDRMHEAITEWLRFNVERKAWDKVADIAEVLRDLEEERTK